MKNEGKQKRNTQKLRMIIVVLSIVLIALIIVAVCLGSKGDSGEGQAQLNVVKTPYCSLKYPNQWGEQMAVEEFKTNDATSYVFYALIEGKRYDLFAVHFGNPAPGTLFGYLSDIPVYVDCYSIPDRSELSDSELSRVLSMMEGVNVVTQSVESAPGYEKPL